MWAFEAACKSERSYILRMRLPQGDGSVSSIQPLLLSANPQTTVSSEMLATATLGAYRRAEEQWQALARGSAGAEALVAEALLAAGRRDWPQFCSALLLMRRVFKHNRRASHPERGVGAGVADSGGHDAALAQRVRAVSRGSMRGEQRSASIINA